MTRLVAPIICVSLLFVGCGRSGPTFAGGKPVHHWVESLQDPDPKVRKAAIIKLGNVGEADPAVLPTLLAALKDREAIVRREAILALMKCGASAKEAVPTLTDLQKNDRDMQVRDYATKALAKLRHTAPATK